MERMAASGGRGDAQKQVLTSMGNAVCATIDSFSRILIALLLKDNTSFTGLRSTIHLYVTAIAQLSLYNHNRPANTTLALLFESVLRTARNNSENP